MTSTEALHTAARRYAIDRAAEWSRRYGELQATEARERRKAGLPEPTTYSYSDGALATFPRYHVLHAIQAAVEALRASDFDSLDDARERLAAVGMSAENLFTRPPHGEIEKRAMDEERALFADYLRGLTDDELAAVAPLPLRRTLSAEESARLWRELENRWGVKGYWYPLDRALDADPPRDAVAFKAEAFDKDDVQARLREALGELGVTRLWEVRELDTDTDKEIELASFEPIYTGAEGYWLDASFEWLVYASHESSVTVAGDRLLPTFQQLWPSWAEHLYDGSY
jgi:hypothetical protein